MSLVFVVFMDIHYCFCFHGCAHASIHNGNQVLANIGKEPMKKEVRMEYCPYIKKCHCTSTTNYIFSSAKVSTRSPRPPNASTGSAVVHKSKIPSWVHSKHLVEKKLSSPRFVQNTKDEKENTNDETVRPISAGGLPTSIMLSHFESIVVSKVERNSR